MNFQSKKNRCFIAAKKRKEFKYFDALDTRVIKSCLLWKAVAVSLRSPQEQPLRRARRRPSCGRLLSCAAHPAFPRRRHRRSLPRSPPSPLRFVVTTKDTVHAEGSGKLPPSSQFACPELSRCPTIRSAPQSLLREAGGRHSRGRRVSASHGACALQRPGLLRSGQASLPLVALVTGPWASQGQGRPAPQGTAPGTESVLNTHSYLSL